MKDREFLAGYMLSVVASICVSTGSKNLFYGIATFCGLYAIGLFISSAVGKNKLFTSGKTGHRETRT